MHSLQTFRLAFSALGLRNRIVLRFFCGNCNVAAQSLYPGRSGCQFSTAHAGGQDCSPRLVAGDYSDSLIISLALERDTDARGYARIMQVQGCCQDAVACGPAWTFQLREPEALGRRGRVSKQSRAAQDCQHHGRELSAPREGKVNRFNAVPAMARNSNTQRGVIRSARILFERKTHHEGQQDCSSQAEHCQ